VGVLLVAVVLGWLAPARASIELDWEAPDECPTEPEVRATLQELLGSAQAREPVAATARVQRTNTGEYAAHLVVEMAGHRSDRDLVAAECDALAEAAALVIAVTVDPAQALDDAMAPVDAPAPAIPEPAPVEPVVVDPVAAGPGSPPASMPSARAAPPPRRATTRRIRGVHLRAFGGMDWGSVPAITGAVGAAVGIHGRWFRGEAAGSWTFAREGGAPSEPEARGRVGLGALAVRGCGVPAWRTLEFPLCAAIEAGALQGRGVGETVDPSSAHRPWVAVAFGPALAWLPIPRLAVVVGIDAVMPVWRARFLIGDEQVHRPQPIGVRAGLGLEFRFQVPP